jgi:hypothetical protein
MIVFFNEIKCMVSRISLQTLEIKIHFEIISVPVQCMDCTFYIYIYIESPLYIGKLKLRLRRTKRKELQKGILILRNGPDRDYRLLYLYGKYPGCLCVYHIDIFLIHSKS